MQRGNSTLKRCLMDNKELLKTRINFSKEEKLILKNLVNKNKILWSKQSDAVTNGKKRKAWETLCREYNTTPGCQNRNVKQLQKLWNNIKFTHRKKIATEKKDAITGRVGFAERVLEEYAVKEVISDTLDIEIKDSVNNDLLYLKKKVNHPTSKCKLSTINENISVSSLNQPSISKHQHTRTNDTSFFSPPHSTTNENVSTSSQNQHSVLKSPISVDDFDGDMSVFIQEEDVELFEHYNGTNINEKTKFKKQKPNFTYQDLLLHKKEEMDKFVEIKIKLMEAKTKAALAKENAANAKAEYYKNKLQQSKCNK